MKAYLVLKHAGDDTAMSFPQPRRSRDRRASEETVRKAEKAARQLGFTVVSATPIQVTIEGPKEQFEKAFSSRLKSAGKRGGPKNQRERNRPSRKRSSAPISGRGSHRRRSPRNWKMPSRQSFCPRRPPFTDVGASEGGGPSASTVIGCTIRSGSPTRSTQSADSPSPLHSP